MVHYSFRATRLLVIPLGGVCKCVNAAMTDQVQQDIQGHKTATKKFAEMRLALWRLSTGQGRVKTDLGIL